MIGNVIKQQFLDTRDCFRCVLSMVLTVAAVGLAGPRPGMRGDAALA